MQTIRDFAKDNGISYEAVRKQIKRYEKKELQGHIIRKGRTQYLDDFAVNFLKERRKNDPVVVFDSENEIKKLMDENKALLIQIAELQNQLLQEKDTVKLLQEEKIQMLEERTPKKHWWSIFHKEKNNEKEK